ncbi:AMP-binding protein, partial [Acinetobacter baumannii]
IKEIPDRLHQTMDRAVAATPDHPALVEGSVIWSYRKLSESIQQVASALRELGVRPGDRIMIVSENCIALAALLLGASRIDA